MESVDKETESMPQKKRPIRRGPRPTSVSKQGRLANARERQRAPTLNKNITI